jgi:LAO/AO transport system kinase
VSATRRPPLDRRALSRALSRAARAGAGDILGPTASEPAWRARLIGVTGAPGSGKSTLLAQLAKHRFARASLLAIVAIDPTSPKSQGSVLGDRIRMDALAEDPRVYIRSLPSRHARDGLTDNLVEVLATLDRFGFDEVLVETVGVGQTAYGVRALADVEVLVLTPGAGDSIQAMKAGIIETADIIVVNKSDLAGAQRLEAELLGIFQAGTGAAPPVIRVRQNDEHAIAALNTAIDDCLNTLSRCRDASDVSRRRRRFRVHALMQRRLEEIFCGLPPESWDDPLASLYRRIVDELRADAGAQR